MKSRTKLVGLLAAGMLLAPAAASAAYVDWSYTTAKTDRVANWEGLKWGYSQAGSSAYTCGDVTGSTSGVYVYYAIVRDIQLLPDSEITKKGSYGWDSTLCSSRATIVNGNTYYERIFTNVESAGAHSVWAESRK